MFSQLCPKTFTTEKELLAFEEEFLKLPYTKGRSLWDAIIIKDYMGSKGQRQTILLFRFHHILADGYSIFSSLMRFFSEEDPQKGIEKNISTVQTVDPYKSRNKIWTI